MVNISVEFLINSSCFGCQTGSKAPCFLEAIMLNTEESSWLAGSLMPSSIPQAPGPLWCSWCPSPTAKDPGWARDCQGSLSRRATTQGWQANSDAGRSSEWEPLFSPLPLPAEWAPLGLLGYGFIRRQPLPGDSFRAAGGGEQRGANCSARVCRREAQS